MTQSQGARLDSPEAERARSRYDRIAPLYDVMDALPERRYRAWRRRLWPMLRGPRVLEVGVGTGKNMPYYPEDLAITAIDLSPKMLERAQRRASDLGIEVDLQPGDAQALEFVDETFDEVVATFVFCSVPDPVLGLREARRVLKPGGRLRLLEHVRAGNALLGRIQDVANPLSVRMSGVNINRRTVDSVEASGLAIERVEDVGMRGIFKLIVATKT